MDGIQPDVLTIEEQRTTALQGAREAAKLAQERYGIDLAKVARDPSEAVALGRAFAADKMLDPSTPPHVQGAFCKLLMDSVSPEDRKSKAPLEEEPESVPTGARRFRLASSQ